MSNNGEARRLCGGVNGSCVCDDDGVMDVHPFGLGRSSNTAEIQFRNL
jgi:hypothetical protein